MKKIQFYFKVCLIFSSFFITQALFTCCSSSTKTREIDHDKLEKITIKALQYLLTGSRNLSLKESQKNTMDNLERFMKVPLDEYNNALKREQQQTVTQKELDILRIMILKMCNMAALDNTVSTLYWNARNQTCDRHKIDDLFLATDLKAFNQDRANQRLPVYTQEELDDLQSKSRELINKK